MKSTEETAYTPRFSVIVKSTNFSRGYVIRATDAIDLLQKLSERCTLPYNAEISYSEILLDSDIID